MTEHRTPIRSLILASILAAGFLVVWACVGGMVIAPILEAWFPKERIWPERVVIRFDGEPLIGDAYINEAPFRTLDGQDVPAFNPSDAALTDSLVNGPSTRNERRWEPGWSSRFTQIGDNSWKSSKKTKAANWYFVCDGMVDGHGYFANCGANPGYIGRNGLRCDKPPREEQFSFNSGLPILAHGMYNQGRGTPIAYDCLSVDGKGNPWILDLLTEDGLMQIDLDNCTVKLLRTEKAVSACVGWKASKSNDPQREQSSTLETVVLFRTTDRIRVLDFDGDEQCSFLLPNELRDQDVTWNWFSEDQVVMQKKDADQRDPCQEVRDLFWVNQAGKIMRREKVCLKKEHESPTVGEKISLSLFVPCPGILAGIIALEPGMVPSVEQKSLSYLSSVCLAFDEMWPALLGSAVIGACLSPLCYCRQRKYGLPWTGVWTAFVLLFGLPGYLGYLAHRTWPARVPCPNCEERVPRDRPTCLACGREFPAPAMKGIEVFA